MGDLPSQLVKWRDRAACRGMETEIFFPTTKAGRREALAVCSRCDVRFDCLAWALSWPDQRDLMGIWGGHTQFQRILILKGKRNEHRIDP